MIQLGAGHIDSRRKQSSPSKGEGMLWDRRWTGSATSIPAPAAPLLEHKENTPLQAPSTTCLSSHFISHPSSCTLEPSSQDHCSTELTSVLPKPATLLMAFLFQQMATPSIGPRQKGGGLPRLFPLPDSPRSLFSSSCLLWVSVVMRELSLVVVCGLLIAVASLVEHRL